MTPAHNALQHVIEPETWNEELARGKKLRDALQKRSNEKKARKEIEHLKRESAVGRLRIEP